MTSLDLVKTGNEQFKEQYPSIMKKIKNKKLQEFDPKISEINQVYEIIKKYIIDKKRKIYGGFALDMLLTEKNKDYALYDETDVPDIDFYSPEPLIDLVAMCNKIYDAGFKPVIGQEAQHKETYSIFVNHQLYCDISYMPSNIYYKTRFIQLNGFMIIHPWFMMIDYFRMFTDPMISYWRLEKHFSRYLKLQKSYPLPLIQKSLSFEPFKNREISEAMNYLFDYLATKSTILFTGFYTYNYYLYISNYKKYNGNYDYTFIPYYEVYSTDYIKDGIDILEYIKTLPEAIRNNFSHVENYPFFQFYGYNTIIYYNDGKDQIPILYIYSNNKRCIPFKQVDYIKFPNIEKNKFEINKSKKINIGSFDHNILHGLIILIKVRVDEDNQWNDIIYKYINGIVTFRNYYLEIKNFSIYSDSIFQGFVVECIGETVLPERERRLVIEVRKKLGKPYVYKYEAGVSKNPGNYVFLNSSGNPINLESNKKLLIENLNKKLIDDLEGEEKSNSDDESELTKPTKSTKLTKPTKSTKPTKLDKVEEKKSEFDE